MAAASSVDIPGKCGRRKWPVCPTVGGECSSGIFFALGAFEIGIHYFIIITCTVLTLSGIGDQNPQKSCVKYNLHRDFFIYIRRGSQRGLFRESDVRPVPSVRVMSVRRVGFSTLAAPASWVLRPR